MEREYDGKVWGVGWYLSGNSIAYRKDLFKKAGLNPDGDYTKWADFLAACEKLKAAGITPIAGGLKDGWFGGWIWQLLGKQGLDSAEDFKKASIGESKMHRPEVRRVVGAAGGAEAERLLERGHQLPGLPAGPGPVRDRARPR